jgi:hypothetical protein
MMYNLTFTVITEYFVKKRLFVISVLQTLTGKSIISFIYYKSEVTQNINT